MALAALPNVRQFIAEKAGITLPAAVKGTPGMTGKELTALCVAKGHSADVVKAWRKEFDGLRKQHYIESGMVVGMLAADPSIRKSVRLAKNAKGEVIGANATFRKERSAAVGGAVRIAQLELLVAQLQAKLAPALPA